MVSNYKLVQLLKWSLGVMEETHEKLSNEKLSEMCE